MDRARVLKGIIVAIAIAIVSLVYWGNGNHLNTVGVPIVQMIESERMEVRQLRDELASKNREVASLKTQIKTRNYVIRQYEMQIAELKRRTPTLASIRQELATSTANDEGLRHETKRILGDMGITHIVLSN